MGNILFWYKIWIKRINSLIPLIYSRKLFVENSMRGYKCVLIYRMVCKATSIQKFDFKVHLDCGSVEFQKMSDTIIWSHFESSTVWNLWITLTDTNTKIDLKIVRPRNITMFWATFCNTLYVSGLILYLMLKMNEIIDQLTLI